MGFIRRQNMADDDVYELDRSNQHTDPRGSDVYDARDVTEIATNCKQASDSSTNQSEASVECKQDDDVDGSAGVYDLYTGTDQAATFNSQNPTTDSTEEDIRMTENDLYQAD